MGKVYAEDLMIAPNTTVDVDYTLTVDGQVVDTSEGKAPLQYTQGAGMIIPGLERQLEGLKIGDERDLNVPAAEAYGPVNPTLMIEVPKANLDSGIDPKVGMVLQMQQENGQMVPGTITEVKDQSIVLDFNHPLAGKDLTFKVKVVDIKKNFLDRKSGPQ